MARAFIPTLLTVAISLAVSLAGAELVFRLYERMVLTHELALDGDGPIDLPALGFNDDPVTPGKPPGEVRILSIGDSFTASIVRAPFDMNGEVERLLSTPERPVRLVNLGIGDRSFRDYARMARFWGERLEHDAVLVQVYLGNDFEDAAGPRELFRRMTGEERVARFARLDPERGAGHFIYGPGVRVPHVLPGRMLDYVADLWLRRRVAVTPDDPRYLDLVLLDEARYLDHMRGAARVYDAAEETATLPGYVAAAALLRQLAAADRGGRPAALLLSPPALFYESALREGLARGRLDPGRLDPDRPYHILRLLARRLDAALPLLDLGPCFAALAPAEQERLHYPRNTHRSADGEARAAALVAPALARLWLAESIDAPGCLAGRDPAPAAAESYARTVDRILRHGDLAAAVDRVRRAIAGGRPAVRRIPRLLADEGFREAEGRIVAALDRVGAGGGGPQEPPSQLSGWAADLGSADDHLHLLALSGGRLLGWGTTRGRDRSDVVAHLAAAGAWPAGRGEAVGFVVPVLGDCGALAGGVTLIVLSADRRYAILRMRPAAAAC